MEVWALMDGKKEFWVHNLEIKMVGLYLMVLLSHNGLSLLIHYWMIQKHYHYLMVNLSIWQNKWLFCLSQIIWIMQLLPQYLDVGWFMWMVMMMKIYFIIVLITFQNSFKIKWIQYWIKSTQDLNLRNR